MLKQKKMRFENESKPRRPASLFVARLGRPPPLPRRASELLVNTKRAPAVLLVWPTSSSAAINRWPPRPQRESHTNLLVCRTARRPTSLFTARKHRPTSARAGRPPRPPRGPAGLLLFSRHANVLCGFDGHRRRCCAPPCSWCQEPGFEGSQASSRVPEGCRTSPN